MKKSDTLTEAAIEWLKAVLRNEPLPWPDSNRKLFLDQLWNIGLAEGVLALCHHKLSNSNDWITLPEAFQKRLTQFTQQEAICELSRKREIKQLLNDFAAANIHPLLLKGTPLAYSLYTEPYLRYRCDTDLLFPDHETAKRASLILEKKGYRRPNAISGKHVSHEFVCYKNDPTGLPHTLDIHWQLSNTQHFAQALKFPELANHSQPVPNLCATAQTLAPEHALLLSCMHRIAHTAQGTSNRLIWLYDIHLLSNKFTTEQWSRFACLAQQKALCAICLDGIQTTQSSLGTTIPKEVISQLENNAKGEFFQPTMGASSLRMNVMNFHALPSWKQRLQLLKEHLFPSSEYMLKKYNTNNKALLPLLYLKRIIQGIKSINR